MKRLISIQTGLGANENGIMPHWPATIFCICALLLLSASPIAAVADEPRRAIVDADTANEIDDLYAIVRALIAPELKIEGITSAHFTRSTQPNDTVLKSQTLNEAILDRMELRDKIPHPVGADRSMSDSATPIDSPAARLIIERAHAGGPNDKLIVFALGAPTNLASALLLDPSIATKVSFAFIDGDYRDGQWGPGIFNWRNDIHAVKAIFESDVEYFHMPAKSVSVEMVLTKADVDAHLKGRGGVWDYLVERWETFPRTANQPRKVMWDVALIEAIVRPELATRSLVGAPKIHDAVNVEQYPDNPRRVTVFRAIDAKGMADDFWAEMGRAAKSPN